MKWGEVIAEHADRIATIETEQNGKLFAEMRAQARIVQDWLYYFGGLADKVEGSGHPARPQQRPQLHAARAARRGRRHHAVELADLHRDHGARAGAGGRQHRRDQAFGDHARPRHRARAARRGGRHPAGRHQCRHRRPGDRRSAGRSSDGRQDRLHRRRRRRTSDRRARRRAAGQLHAGARRQERQHRVRRCQPGPGRSRRAGRHLRRGRADLRRRIARLCPRRHPRPFRRPSRRARAAIKIGDPLDAATQMGPVATKAQLEKDESHGGRAPSPRAPKSSAAARRANRAGCPTAISSSRRSWTSVEPDSFIVQNEVFGPVLAGHPVRRRGGSAGARQRHPRSASPPASGRTTSAARTRGRAAPGRHRMDQHLSRA